MSIYKKLTAVLAIALIAGPGIFGVSSVINARTQKENAGQREEKLRAEKADTEEDESSEQEDAVEETAGDNKLEKTDSDEWTERSAPARQATISSEQAKTAALQKIAGEVVKSELEDEDGKIVYDYEIRDANGKVFEVEVDAGSGVLVKPAPDDDEEK